LQQRLQIFSETQVFLATLAFARAKGAAERRIENAGYRHPAIPRNFTQRGETWSATFFRFNGAPRSLSTSDQIKL
jgi:hypothetical protein